LADDRLTQIIKPALADLGFDLVRVLLTGTPGGPGRRHLQVMAEPSDLSEMTVDHCATISRHLAAVLDVEDPIREAYLLEVSSPGMDRPLTREQDFDRFKGEMVKVTLLQPLDGRKRFRGTLAGRDEQGRICLDTLTGRLTFTLDELDQARIDPSDYFSVPRRGKGQKQPVTAVPSAEQSETA
jgi:ribosome maturation factor RimP